MCIAIYQPPKTNLTKRELKNCWDTNPDGASFTFVRDNNFFIYKELDSFRRFYKTYREYHNEYGNDKNFIIHFRIGTSGLIDYDNCHPHQVHNELVFIHNGMITIEMPLKQYSDTVHFNFLLKNFPKDFLNYSYYVNRIKNMTRGSKLVFLKLDGSVQIIHEDSGHWNKGIWFSNYSYEDWDNRYTKKYYSYSYKTTQDDYNWDVWNREDDSYFGDEAKIDQKTGYVKYIDCPYYGSCAKNNEWIDCADCPEYTRAFYNG